MKKFEFVLSDLLYDKAMLPIRTKEDLLRLLAHTIKFLMLHSVADTTKIVDNKKLILYIDKMSRLFFCVKDKIFSFRFPFYVSVNMEDNSISISFKDYFEFDSIKSSLLLAILEQEDLFNGTLENVNEKILQEIIENEWENIDLDDMCELVKYLMLFEPGYLRYDHDVEHANGEMHPEHHLDIFFSSNVTMKLGLKNSVESEWLIDLVNILTECKYIV
ncbi:MAG: hypothetical protein ACLVEN_06525 [Anaerotignum lactatifermentans]|uniref:hypothetical protein n=1 Tax=Anaerotignum lactatifermentans TaxID=160404 RepID=UPI00399A45A8